MDSPVTDGEDTSACPAADAPVASPLTGATPIPPAPPPPPFASPLTGATAIPPHPPSSARPPVSTPRSSAGGPRSAASVLGNDGDSTQAAHDPVPASAAAAARRARRAPGDRPSGPLRVRALGAAAVELGG